MSFTPGLNTLAIKQFSSEFMLQVQKMKRSFDGKTLEIYDLTGSSYEVKFAKQWAMKKRGAYHSTVATTAVEYRKPVMSRNEYVQNISSDIFEQTLVNASELRIQAENAVAALNRIQDQETLDAFEADRGSMETISMASGMTVDKLIEVGLEFNNKNIDQEDRYIVATPYEMASLLKDAKATSSDYANQMYALISGKIDNFMGFKFNWFGEMEEGGLVLDGAVRHCYAYTKKGILNGWWMRPTVTTTYKDEAFSHLVLPRVICGSKVIDTDRVLSLEVTES